jgi:hypothetical protein
VKSNIANILKLLTVPYGAPKDRPRVVIGADDPLAAQSDDAAVVWYWDDQRGYVLGVERSGEGPSALGQLRLYALMANPDFGPDDPREWIRSPVLDVDYTPDGGSSPELNTRVTLSGGSRLPVPDRARVRLDDDGAVMVEGLMLAIGSQAVALDGSLTVAGPTLVDQLTAQAAQLGDVEVTGSLNVAGAPVLATERGSVLVTNTGTSWTRPVTFAEPFTGANPPTVLCNINSGANSVAQWVPRAFSVSNSGFTLCGTGPSVTWTNVGVQWIAIGSR